jgi:signal transduction histidine kinase
MKPNNQNKIAQLVLIKSLMQEEIDAFDRRILRVICGMAILISINGLVHAIAGKASDTNIFVHAAIALIFGIFLMISYFRKNLRRLSILLILYFYIVEVLMWFVIGGIQSPIRSTTLGILIAIALLSPSRFRLAALAFYVFTVALLIFVEINMPQLFPEGLPPSSTSNIPFNLVIMAAGVALVIYYVKLGYDRNVEMLLDSNAQLLQKQKAFEQQNQSLIEQKEKVSQLKSTMETRVTERTKVLDRAIDQLHEYAYINSHLLRAPVARIKGLLQLLEYEHQEEANETLQKLIEECNTLEDIVGRISQAVNQGAIERQDLDNKEIRVEKNFLEKKLNH